MSSRFDERLKEAGLLNSSEPVSTATYSSTEDLMTTNSEDPGYACLTVQPTGPVMGRSATNKLDKASVELEDDGYANPADALKSNPRIINLQKAPTTPSPPASPVVLEPPSSRSPPSRSPPAGRDSPYESVNNIRKMREKQMKEKELDEKRDRLGGIPVVGVSPTGEAGNDDECGYSRPFDALKGSKFRFASDASSKKPPAPLPWLRTSSNGKIGKESSARALHHIVSPSSSKGSLGSQESVSNDVPRSRRSASTSVAPKVLIKPLGIGRGNRSQGDLHSQGDLRSPAGSKPGNLTSVDSSSNGVKVNRYILQVENKQSDEGKLSRGETGRTRSIDSALHTPAKVTKLRNGRDRVTLISGKSTEPMKPKSDQDK